MFTQSSRDKEGKDNGSLMEYIKYMPHLLDFDNKRLYFKKEIKKLKKSGYSRDLTLYIKRS